MKLHLGIIRRNRIVDSVGQLCSDVVSAWHRFWFEPADPLMLGIVRILTGWMLFYNLLIWSLDLEAFFGNDGLQPLSAIQRMYGSRFVFSFWLWMGDSYLWPVHIGCLTITAMFCLGLATRVTSVLSFLITISYSQRVPIANFGFDQILGLLCLYLSIGPSGAAVSLDAMLSRWRLRRRGLPTVSRKLASARMAMRLIQLHLCAIYFWAGLAKLKGPSWWTGEAMWRVLANQEYQTMDLTWMAWAPWLPFLIAHLTIMWEVFFVVLVWNVRLRPLVLAIGVAMHVGIGAFLGMWTFGLIMAFAYLAFADPDVWRHRLLVIWHWLQRISSPPGNALSGEPPMAASHKVCAAESHPLCIVAASSGDRATLRRYFREHHVPCRAFGDLESSLNLLSRDPFGSILINGTGMASADLINFIADVQDLADVPILVMLTAQQLGAVPEIEKIIGAAWIQLPASMNEIRQQLQSLQNNVPGSSSPVIPELNPETTS